MGSTGPGPAGLTLDAGGLIAFERGAMRVRAAIRLAEHHQLPIVIPAGALAQVWGEGGRQARLAVLLRSTASTVLSLDEGRAKAAGALCRRTRTADVIDASVALAAVQTNTTVLTSDPHDLSRLAPDVAIERV